MTPFYLAKKDHRWVTFLSLKTINIRTHTPCFCGSQPCTQLSPIPRQPAAWLCLQDFIRGELAEAELRAAEAELLGVTREELDCAGRKNRSPFDYMPLLFSPLSYVFSLLFLKSHDFSSQCTT